MNSSKIPQIYTIFQYFRRKFGKSQCNRDFISGLVTHTSVSEVQIIIFFLEKMAATDPSYHNIFHNTSSF